MPFVEEYDSVYIPDAVPDEDSEESTDTAELLHSNSSLRMLNTNLQNNIEMTEDSNMVLRIENSELKNQIKSLKELIQKLQPLVNELEDIRAAKAEKDRACDKMADRCKELAKEKQMLQQLVEDLSTEALSSVQEREQQEKENTKLSSILRALQEQQEENRFYLDQKDNLINQRDFVIEQLKESITQYDTIIQDMKEKQKDLEEQLALALVRSEGSFMNVDTTLAAAPDHTVSLREELGILSEDQVDQMDPDEVQKEEEETVEPLEEQAALCEPKSVTHSCKRICKGLCVAFMHCFMLLGVFGALTLAGGLNTIYRLIRPYCQIHHTGPPPV